MDVFRIANFDIRNRLFVGTGKYATYELMQQALQDSGVARPAPTVVPEPAPVPEARGRENLRTRDRDAR